jgi:hypothetical protein
MADGNLQRADNTGTVNLSRPPSSVINVLQALTRLGVVTTREGFDKLVELSGLTPTSATHTLSWIAKSGLIKYNSFGHLHVSITANGRQLLAAKQ